MFEKRRRWIGWMLALAMMLSLAPQGVLAGDLTDSAAEVQEAYGDGSAADGGSPENGTESGTTLAQGNSGEDNAQSGTAVSGDSGTDSSLFDTASGGEKAVSSSGSGEEESSSGTADRLVQEEGARPAVLLETEADDGTSIRIDAPEGAFPKGIRVTVRAVAADSILDALRTAADDPELAAEDVAAYDFDFWLDDGTHQIEPEKEITVQIGLPELKAGETVSAYHMDSESDETAEAETVTAEQDTGTATLTSDAFSIHAIVRRAQAAGGVKIDYDAESTIHSVTASDGSKIILFCMNDGLHWPHSTPTTPNVPDYSETSIEAFCAANHVSDSSTLARKVKNVLYAGYPYNGYGLYQVVDQAASLTEDEYNQFLDPPAYLRTDFPDSVGSNTFAYSDRSDKSKMALLAKFVQESMALYKSGSTASGLTYAQLTALPFWRAAYCMVTYTDSPIDAYSTLYINGSYVTESQAYTSTSNAVWTLMYSSGVPNNTAVTQDALTTKLLDAAENDTILEQAPSSGSLSVTGDTTFRYSSEDGKWHTGSLTLSAPSGYLTPFVLSLPDGVSEESGKTQVRAGASFSLVSSSPASVSTISLSATVPWMDGDLKVYEPMGNVTASDGKAFQNMVGAVIRTADVSVSASLARADENTDLTFTKKWDDSDNQDGVRPTAEAYASKLNLMNGETEVKNVTPTVTDNGDNTYTVTYSSLPKYVNGAEAAYSVKEDGIDGYTADAETVKNGATLMNTHTPEVTTVTVTKKWEDANNQDGMRVSAADYASKLHLMNGDTEVENVTPTVTDNGDNTYTVTYSSLPKYVNGAEAAYSVKEDGIDGYTADAETVKNGATLMNTHTPEVTTVTVTKKWEDANNQDGMRVSAADYASKLHLMNGDTEVENVTPTVTDNGDNTYTVTYSSLPKYVNGAEAAYSVKEDGIDGYTADAETVKNGGTLTNTHTPEVTTVTVTKKWEDANNQDGMRVSAADYASKLHLMNGDTEVENVTPTVTDNGDNTYTVTYSNLPKYKDGKAIAYSVKEDSIKGYVAEQDTVLNGGTLTNTHKVTSSTTSSDTSSTTSSDTSSTTSSDTSSTTSSDTSSTTSSDTSSTTSSDTSSTTSSDTSSTTSSTASSDTSSTASSTASSDTSSDTSSTTSSDTSSTTSSGGTSPTAGSTASSNGNGTAGGGTGTTGTGSPKTGDSSALELYGALAAVSAAVLLILIGLRRRRKA